MFRLWQDSHKLTQGWKDSFWGSIRGKPSVNNEINDFVGNILQNKFYACCYILLSGTRRCTPICGAAMILRCNWCRNLAALTMFFFNFLVQKLKRKLIVWYLYIVMRIASLRPLTILPQSLYELNDRQSQTRRRGCHCWELQDEKLLFADELVPGP